jgi:hypothetical protein
MSDHPVVHLKVVRVPTRFSYPSIRKLFIRITFGYPSIKVPNERLGVAFPTTAIGPSSDPNNSSEQLNWFFISIGLVLSRMENTPVGGLGGADRGGETGLEDV